MESVVSLLEWTDSHGNASDHYGLLWWNNSDGAIDGIPRDAYWSWGLKESFIVVIGEFPNGDSIEFDPPGELHRGNDWVLVLDDKTRGFAALGANDGANKRNNELNRKDVVR